MDIVDAQVHANVLGTEATLAVMDALGIQGLLFDEYQTTTEDGAPQPGYRLADGAFPPWDRTQKRRRCAIRSGSPS
jgi:L-fuconolactonase